MSLFCVIFGHSLVRDSASWYGPHFWVCRSCGKKIKVFG